MALRRSIRVSSASVSPGPTCARKRALSIPPNMRQLARVAGIGEHGDAAELRQCLDHQHARQDRAAGEVPGEERLVAGQMPTAACRLAREDLVDLVHEQERGPVGEHVLGAHAVKLRDPSETTSHGPRRTSAELVRRFAPHTFSA